MHDPGCLADSLRAYAKTLNKTAQAFGSYDVVLFQVFGRARYIICVICHVSSLYIYLFTEYKEDPFVF